MNSNKLYTPLRYPGGKAAFAPLIASVINKNKLSHGHYLEPYAGGAGVALELLFHDHVSHIHINDIDPAIFDFWFSVTRFTDSFLTLLQDSPVNIQEWYKWRSILRGETSATQIERGFATLFMNRTNRSGILKGGVIGGLKQEGIYKIDARFKKDSLIKRILKISKYSDSISVYQLDALKLLDKAQSFLPEKSLIYLDPPYYVKGKGLYRNFYEHDDHVLIAEKLQSIEFNIPWIVSYDNANEIKQMYGMARKLEYGLNYSAQKKYYGNEVMFFKNGLLVDQNNFSFKFPLVA